MSFIFLIWIYSSNSNVIILLSKKILGFLGVVLITIGGDTSLGPPSGGIIFAQLANKTKKESLTTNIELALSNIRVGAKIAKKL